MQKIISPNKIFGIIEAPKSKSSMQRAVAAALLSNAVVTLHNAGFSNDDKAALNIAKQFGATIEVIDGSVIIDATKTLFTANNLPNKIEINCGESGLGIRMFTPIAALLPTTVVITGEGSLPTRPMHFFDEVLPQLGIEIKSNNGYLPITVKGSLQANDITIDGSLSSQFLTGLLMAFSKALKPQQNESITITVNELSSKPYIDLTLDVMHKFGMALPTNDYYEYFIFDEKSKLNSNSKIDYKVEGDWSGAAFLLVAGAIAGKILVKELDVKSTQADKDILKALHEAKAIVDYKEDGIEVTQPTTLKAFGFDATDCPDLFPPLVALASFCQGTTVIKGVHRLAHKESNRALTLQQEFGKLGVSILLEDDFMKIKGGTTIMGNEVDSCNDHRIAMACAIAALRANGNVAINDAEAVHKSYPNFYEALESIVSY
jgi:3-phosphoshikimate 1-carboxyvinyltransferase